MSTLGGFSKAVLHDRWPQNVRCVKQWAVNHRASSISAGAQNQPWGGAQEHRAGSVLGHIPMLGRARTQGHGDRDVTQPSCICLAHKQGISHSPGQGCNRCCLFLTFPIALKAGEGGLQGSSQPLSLSPNNECPRAKPSQAAQTQHPSAGTQEQPGWGQAVCWDWHRWARAVC